MIEYAITAGEGTLLAYGVTNWIEASDWGIGVFDDNYSLIGEFDGATVIARPCTDDCETGK